MDRKPEASRSTEGEAQATDASHAFDQPGLSAGNAGMLNLVASGTAPHLRCPAHPAYTGASLSKTNCPACFHIRAAWIAAKRPIR
jgi:hypothetical protein